MSKLNPSTEKILNMVEADFQKLVNDYFDNCDKTGKPYLTIGLANYLNIHKQTMADIRRDKVKIFIGTYHKHIFEIALQRIEQYTAEKLLGQNAKQVTGAIFLLKANFGWSDKQEVDVTHKGKINIKFD